MPHSARQPRFGRVLTAMVTPFKADLSMDYDRAAELAIAIIESGSDGVVIAGTTGESATLTMQEQGELFRVVREAVGDKGAVIGGAGANSTSECLELCHYAQKAGCDALLLVAPYYNKPSQEGLYQHFKYVTEHTELPIILYNIPGRCSVNMEPSTVARLAKLPTIVGVKEASGVLDQVTDIISRVHPVRPDFDVYSGDDSITLPIMSVGGVGVVSVAGHLVSAQIQQMVAAFVEGRPEEAARRNAELFPFFKSLFITTNPVPVKAALKLSGWDCGGMRLPMVDATEAEISQLQAALNALKSGVDLKAEIARV
ncbi:MAG: 4-hydroxy-tetrahydrodipicolinate synthase [Armatimonadetes bacterium]|nr:4-hydroxy-tetrahydrodipicolinate synthase [Armatimonadota bacterium]